MICNIIIKFLDEQETCVCKLFLTVDSLPIYCIRAFLMKTSSGDFLVMSSDQSEYIYMDHIYLIF